MGARGLWAGVAALEKLLRPRRRNRDNMGIGNTGRGMFQKLGAGWGGIRVGGRGWEGDWWVQLTSIDKRHEVKQYLFPVLRYQLLRLCASPPHQSLEARAINALSMATLV